MTLNKPYCRLWRPVKGYNSLGEIFKEEGTLIPSLGFLNDERFTPQAEMQSLLASTHLIIRDLYEVLDFVEPHNDNENTYSHRIYELFLRTATEFESNCKGMLKANGYKKKDEELKAPDYIKIAKPARLSEYVVTFHRWLPTREFKPFEQWATSNYKSLPWYKSYNSVKHNRYSCFREANLGNLMNAVAGLLCILHAQIGENMVEAGIERVYASQNKQDEVHTAAFKIKAPLFPDDDQYDFVWDKIKAMPDPVQEFLFV